MEIIQVDAVLHRDGWQGEAAAVRDIGMRDDATYLISELRSEVGASLTLALEPVLPEGGSELVLRTQRMCQGRPSGTGTPAPLTVIVHHGEALLQEAVITPGGSWREDRLPLPRLEQAEAPLTVTLLIAGGERQIAISRLRIEARATVPVEASAGNTQPPVVAAEPVAAEPVAADAVDPIAADGDSSPVAPPVKKRRRARHHDGRYQGDNPATPDVDEAWTEE